MSFLTWGDTLIPKKIRARREPGNARLVDAAKSAGAPTNGLVVDTAGRQRMPLGSWKKTMKIPSDQRTKQLMLRHVKLLESTWWLSPLSKWVITPVINGISRINPLIIGVISHLLSGMSHQVYTVYILYVYI